MGVGSVATGGLDVKHEEFDHLGDGGQRWLWVPPVLLSGYFGELKADRIDETQRVGDLVAENELANVTELLGHLGRQANEIVLADRCDLDTVCELVVGCGSVDIHRDDLF